MHNIVAGKPLIIRRANKAVNSPPMWCMYVDETEPDRAGSCSMRSPVAVGIPESGIVSCLHTW